MIHYQKARKKQQNTKRIKEVTKKLNRCFYIFVQLLNFLFKLFFPFYKAKKATQSYLKKNKQTINHLVVV